MRLPSWLWVALILGGGPTVSAQFPFSPFVEETVDAASNTRGIAPGALFVVKGYFALDELSWAPLPFPAEFNGMSIILTPTTGAAPVRAWIVYLHPWQLAAVLPSSTTPGSYSVMVKTPAAELQGLSQATVVARKYRSFSNNQEGWGLAVVQNFISAGQVGRNMFATGTLPGGQTKGPAIPGQSEILWGLGLGAIEKADNAPPGALDLRSRAEVKVAVGGVNAAVTYAGRSPEFPGVDQINFVIPDSAPTGCNIALEVTVNGEPSNPVSIAIAAPRREACEHPVVARDLLERLDQGYPHTPAELLTQPGFEDYAAGEFLLMVEDGLLQGGRLAFTAHGIMGSFQALNAATVSRLDFRSFAPGRCGTFRGDAFSQPLTVAIRPNKSADGGLPVLDGPGVPNVALRWWNGVYYQLLSVRADDGTSLTTDPSYVLTPAAYRLRGPGGAQLGVFEAVAALPPFLVWTNRAAISQIDRTAGLPLTWSGGGQRDAIVIQGADGAEERGVTSFICVPPPGATAFTVPAAALRALQPRAGAVSISSWSADASVRFAAPVKGSSKTIPATFGYQMSSLKDLPIR